MSTISKPAASSRPELFTRAPSEVPDVPVEQLHGIFRDLMDKLIADTASVTREVVAQVVGAKAQLSPEDAATVTDLIYKQVRDYTEPAPDLTGKTVVTLSFSDTLDSQTQAIELLKKHGLVGTFYVNSPRINGDDDLTQKQLLDEQLRGSEIGGHSIDHDELHKMSRGEQLHQVADDRYSLMMDFGLWATAFGYPKSGADEEVQQSVIDSNYNNARETGSLGGAVAETVPPENMFDIRLHGSVKSPDSAEMEGWIREAQEAGGGWQWVSFHGVGDGGGYETEYEVLDQFLGWLAAEQDKGNLVVMTPDQVLDGTIKPAITAEEAAQLAGGEVDGDEDERRARKDDDEDERRARKKDDDGERRARKNDGDDERRTRKGDDDRDTRRRDDDDRRND
jgi:hypothetical protein